MKHIPGLTLVTRTDARPEFLRAFIAHHLPVCESAIVLGYVKPDDDVEEVASICAEFGDKVDFVVRRAEKFSNMGIVILEELLEQRTGKTVLHLDKDEFVDDVLRLRKWTDMIETGRIDCVWGPMINRFAPGIKFFEPGAESYEELSRRAPVRIQGRFLATGGAIARKCYLTRHPFVRSHQKPSGWRELNRNPRPGIEHFCYSTSALDRMRVKMDREDDPYSLKDHSWVHDKMRWLEAVRDDSDFELKQFMRAHLFTFAQDYQGWMNYKDIYRKIGASIPEGGSFVEIGVFKGKSLAFIAEVCQMLGKKVDMVGYDLFEPNFGPGMRAFNFNPQTSEEWIAIVERNLAKSTVEEYRPRVKQAVSHEAAALHEDKSVDALWVDGDHSVEGVYRDLTAWLPKLKPSGILCGHDSNFPTVREGLKKAGVKWSYISQSSWIRKGDESKLHYYR